MRLRFFHIKKSIFYRGKLTIRFPIRPQACPDPFANSNQQKCRLIQSNDF